MKWLFVCLVVCLMVAPAMGEDPYIAIVGKDCVTGDTNLLQEKVCVGGAASPWYSSPKYRQFMYDENADPFFIPVKFGTFPPVNQYTRVGGTGEEQFRSQRLNFQAEVCHVDTNALILTGDPFNTLPNSKSPAGNSGFYEWFIRAPKKPDGEINIVIQCGVLKPNAVAVYGRMAIELCAAETGERVGYGTCVRQEVDPGVSPVIQTALPKITAIAYPGPYNVAFSPFHLTAFKNPSAYTVTFDAISGTMSTDGTSQVLDGGSSARVLLKACMDKTVITKLPVTGQINALGEVENDLEMGDMIYVRMDVPRQNTVDIYCHAQSVRIMGLGESPY
jgi:hypothetical protein